eukprot:GFKZ01011760.1.p1 GENE.GFKZ01011760.1~~GFKZ01011760.1.p1  ORF type:complete len:374 (-),score=40.90 GFKZ01011760.1:1557-2678(-)
MQFYGLAFAGHYSLAPRVNSSHHSRCHVTKRRTVRCSARRLDDENPGSWHNRADWKMESSVTGDGAVDPMSTSSPLLDGQDGSISGSGGGSFSSGGSGGDDESDADLPEDMRKALAKGLLTKEALERYRSCLNKPLMRIALAIPSFRTRFLADSAFAFKLLVQELIGNGTALASEIAVRGKDIVDELEYVGSDLIVGSVIEAAFVWLLAPTIRVPVQNAGMVSRYIGSLPSHIFQPSTVLQKFTLAQRCGSFIYAGIQYGVMGFAGGVVGTWITYGLIEMRKRLDKEYKPERPLPAVVPNSAAWGAFLAGSSNTRFQIVEGIELGIARVAGGRAPAIVNGSIVGLRLANNYWGGVQFVQFFRFLGLHATASEG